MQISLFGPADAFGLWQLRVGWVLVLAGLVAGLLLGLGFHREEFLGGYASLRRRLVRLGHVALVALGALNVLWAMSASSLGAPALAGRLFIAGSFLMPLMCFLVAWQPKLRLAFAAPALCLVGALGLLASGGVA